MQDYNHYAAIGVLGEILPDERNFVSMHPTAKDALYVRASNWYADNQGYAVPAGAANWGLLGQHYTFKDMSLIGNYTRIVSSSLVNEVSVGYRHSTEAGSALSQQGLDAVTKSKIGYALGQFTPSMLNDCGMCKRRIT